MGKFRIPDSLLSGFEKIAIISDDVADLIYSEIERSSFGEGLEKLASTLYNQYSEISKEDYKSIVTSIYSIMHLDELRADRQGKKRIFSQFIDSIIDESQDVEINRNKLEKNLKRFVELKDNVEDTLKGYELLLENEKNLRDWRLITDVRFIFKDDINKTSPNKAVIVHSLKLEYTEGSSTKHLFLALDKNDIQDMIKTLKRASKKESLLRSDPSLQSINFLELDTKD